MNSKRATKLSLAAAVATAAVGAAFAMAGSAHGGTTDDPTKATSATIKAEWLTFENRIAQCMKGRGHQYLVNANPSDVVAEEALQKAVAEGKQGEDITAAVEAATKDLPADPNEEVLAKLPESQQAAWHDGLLGTDTQAGCAEPSMAMSADNLRALEVDAAKSEQAKAAAAADPAVIASQSGYVSCMAASAFTVTDAEQIFAQIEAKEDDVNKYPYPDALPPNADTADQMRHKAETARALLAETRVADFTARANTAHEACIAPYEQALETTFERLLDS